jgi:crotonobetainyl-CoA:carnitine CoA-transferase CaiB-like acyl-CoA transferase
MLAERSYEKSGAFNMVNRNKLGITLDLQRAEGKALLKRLVELADVVIENYSGDVLAKLALDYAALSAVRPDLVMVSMPAFGTDGPWRSYRAYGSTVEQISGLPHLNGHADWPPTMQHVAYGDAVGGINGAAAALTALAHRQATGRGQYVDLSQAECLFPLAAHGIVAQSLPGKPFARRGSRREEICPSGIFRCLGDDAWVAIQLTDERTWADFAELIGAPDLRGLSLAERRACEEEIEGRIEMWTTERRPVGAMAALQAIGVAAGSCYAMGDLLLDPQLQARGFWQVLERAVVGPSPNPAPPYRFSADPLTVRWPAPTLGEHNARVLGDLLGLSDDELAALSANGVIGQRPLLD